MSMEAVSQPVDRLDLAPLRPPESPSTASKDSVSGPYDERGAGEGNNANGRTLLRQADRQVEDGAPTPKSGLIEAPRRSSQSMTSRMWAVAARVSAALPRMLAEEQAYGHAFLVLPVFIGLGAVIWFVIPTEPAVPVLLATFLVSAAISFLMRRYHGRLRYLPVLVTLLLAGMLLAALEDWRRATVVLDQPITTVVTGVVDMREPSGAGRWRYVLALESTASPKLRRQPERITVLSRGRAPAFEIGDRISGRARISPPSGPALPGLVDFAFASYFDGVGGIGFFYGAPVKLEGDVTASWSQGFERMVFSWRSAIASRIRDTVPGDAGAFAAAIVTDERRAISIETTEALRVSGLAHIVAISGLNMALAAGIFFIGMRSFLALLPGFAQAFPVKKVAAGAALLMATGYYLISGFGVSAERAYIMMAIMLAAVFFDRPSISLRNVALSALVVLVISPSEILGPSFQMSFAATVALVAGYSAWSRKKSEDEEPPWRPAALKPVLGIGHLVIGVFATSLIGGLSTAIFSIDHFHRMSTYGLAANLAAMPLVSFIVMPFGLMAMLLMPFGLDGPFLQIMGMGLEGVILVAKTVADWGGDVALGRQPVWFLPVATVGLLVLTLFRTRLYLLGLPFLVLAVILSWRAGRDPPPEFLISEDGSLVALLAGEQVATNRARPPSFIYSQWRQALLLPEPIVPQLPAVTARKNPPSETKVSTSNTAAVEKASGGAAGNRIPLTSDELDAARHAMRQALATHQSDVFTCSARSWCVVRPSNGPTIAVVEDARFAGPACDVVKMVIAARARFQICRSGALMINGEALRRTGALEIRFNGSANAESWSTTAAMAGSDRSWMRHRQYDWRHNVFDPTLPEPLALLIGTAKISDNGE